MMPLFALHRIEVSGFRGVINPQVLDFTSTPPGLYFVRGINYEGARLGSNAAGKSTLLTESLLWALTGRTSRAQRPGASVENRLFKGTTSVAIEFALGGVAHSVVRERNPNNLLLDGQKVEQQEIDALLPVTDAALHKSVLIDQFGEMFLSLRPEAKSQMFTEVLGLDQWIRASDLAGVRADGAERALQDLRRKVDSTKAALAEVADQHEVARLGEVSFDVETDSLIAAARQRVAELLKESENALDALNDARWLAAAAGSDEVVAIESRKTRLKELRHSASTVASKAAIASRELSHLEDHAARYEPSISLCPECGQPVDAAHVKRKREALVLQIAELKIAVVDYDRGIKSTSTEVEKEERAIEQMERRVISFREAQSAVAIRAERSIGADRGLSRAREDLAALDMRVNQFTKLCDDLEARIEHLRREIKGLLAQEGAANKQASIGRFWHKGFREIRLQQIDSALLELELAVNRHAESLGLDGWRIAFATERETKKGSMSHGFTVSLYPPGSDEPVSWDTYCGGEVQRWQLAATFGLAEVLLARAGVSTDFEILDEPTRHLSPEGIDDLLTCLSDRARDLGRRIFLIDHNSLDRGSFDGVVVVAKTAERGTYIEDAGGVLGVGEVSRTAGRKSRVVLSV